jgi:flagellar basal-body rod modification protein FlgD
VAFAQVEQQLKSNASLSTLVTLQQGAQATQALALVGATVVVNGATVNLANGQANWTLTATKPATTTVTITNPTGQTACTGQFTVNSDSQSFT